MVQNFIPFGGEIYQLIFNFICNLYQNTKVLLVVSYRTDIEHLLMITILVSKQVTSEDCSNDSHWH